MPTWLHPNYEGLGEFETVMQTWDAFECLDNFREFSQRLRVSNWDHVNTGKVQYYLYKLPYPNWPIRSPVYYPDILRYQFTDLTWLRYQASLGLCCKYLTAFFGTLRQNVRLVWSRHGYWSFIKLQTMAWSLSPDVSPKQTRGTIRCK